MDPPLWQSLVEAMGLFQDNIFKYVKIHKIAKKTAYIEIQLSKIVHGLA